MRATTIWPAIAGAILTVGCSDAAPPAGDPVDSGSVATFASDTKLASDSKTADTGKKVDTSTEDALAGELADDSADSTAASEVAADSAAGADADDVQEPPTDVSPAACTSQCGGKSCGDDGCGGSCGSCLATQQCQVNKCVAKPNLGCAGLALKENWAGKFKGDCTFVAVGGLVPINAKTSGEMSFAIKCFNSKYLVNGKMDGEASGNKFGLTIGGTYDPAKLLLAGTLSLGEILLWNLFTYKFEGPIDGTLDPATNTFSGKWKVDSTEVLFLGQPSPTTPPFKCSGTWSATGS